jgi:hypothetical protein
MSYATYDFSESLKQTIGYESVDSVLAAWGHGTGMGEDAGKGWSEGGATEWSGGFLLRLKDGRFAYLCGWCDYTGWGCQDGAEVKYFDEQPALKDLDADAVEFDRWDLEPADLNRWLQSDHQEDY